MVEIAPRKFGVIGLGKMGGGIARQALGKGSSVVGLDRNAPARDLVEAGLTPVSSLQELARALSRPRVILLYVPAGPPVDEVLAQLTDVLEAGDVVADGGNSYWGDSIRRHSRLKENGLHFVDVGTSGGPGGARDGACFMVGGEAEPIALLEPLLKSLAVEGGYVHAGPPGAGHFVKLVHNGIEFGMLQAIAEGVALLERHPQNLPVADVLACWRHGSVIRSWLVDLIEQSYRGAGGLSKAPPYVEDTGEVNWLVDDALRMEVPIPVITQSVIQLVASRDSALEAPRAIAMMRHGFGGHPFGADAGIRRERETGRVGVFVNPRKP